MRELNKKILFLSMSLFIFGCGVKGKPNPPKDPPSLGRGEPMYKETKKKKTSSGSSSQSEEGLSQ